MSSFTPNMIELGQIVFELSDMRPIIKNCLAGERKCKSIDALTWEYRRHDTWLMVNTPPAHHKRYKFIHWQQFDKDIAGKHRTSLKSLKYNNFIGWWTISNFHKKIIDFIEKFQFCFLYIIYKFTKTFLGIFFSWHI